MSRIGDETPPYKIDASQWVEYAAARQEARVRRHDREVEEMGRRLAAAEQALADDLARSVFGPSRIEERARAWLDLGRKVGGMP